MTTGMLPPLPEDVRWSVCLREAATSRVLAAHAPEQVLRTASVGKVFLLLEVARRLETGELDPDEPLSPTPEQTVADSGLWYLMRTGTLGVVDLCWLVGGFSDNLATNVLLRRVGLDAVTALTRSLGVHRSALLDRVREDRGPQHPPTLSVGCAEELSEVLARLHRGELVSSAVSARVRGWLAANADLSMVASAFGLDPLAHGEPDRGVLLLNKTGTISTVRVDVGVAAGPSGAVAWAVQADWQDATRDPRGEVLAVMAEIGRRVADLVGVPAVPAGLRPARGSG
ncbi:serine hydrolase [Desertihabitans aurantiacus]|uniref:serine hydrolase n=1 Tax=Desertihabitans aurantiacus TaxID=2282477 RepID=UPI0013004D65|nr:serine hydrolase [Desertihabitans aurantiacus]